MRGDEVEIAKRAVSSASQIVSAMEGCLIAIKSNSEYFRFPELEVEICKCIQAVHERVRCICEGITGE